MAISLDFLQGRILQIVRTALAQAFSEGVSAPNISISGIEGFDKLTDEQKELVTATFNLFVSSLCSYQNSSAVILEPVNYWLSSPTLGAPTISFGIDGTVSLDGGVIAGASTHFLTVPDAFRPLNEKVFVAVVNGAPGIVRILPTGQVTTSISNGEIGLSGISYRR